MRKFLFVALVLGLSVCCGLQVAAFAQDSPASQEEKKDVEGGAVQAQYFRVSELIGKEITNEQGETLGTLTDVIAGKNGSIQYLLISPASGIGTAEKLVPVPWTAVDVRVEQDRVIIRLSKEQLANAPSFTQEELAGLGEAQVQRRIYSYYGAVPEQEPNFYQENQPPASPASSGTESRSEAGAYRYKRNPEYQKFGELHGFYGGMQSWPYSENYGYWPYNHDRYTKGNTNY